MRMLIPLAAAVLVIGCGVNPGTKSDPVDVTGKVTMAGKPVSGVVLNLQVITTGSPAAIPLTGGEFKHKATPGKYTWYLSEGKAKGAINAIPKKYQEGAMDRTIDIAAGTTLDLKVQ